MLVLEYLKVLFSWPVVFLLILLILIRLYHLEIGKLIDRVVKIGNFIEAPHQQSPPVQGFNDGTVHTPEVKQGEGDTTSLGLTKEGLDFFKCDPDAMWELQSAKDDPENYVKKYKKVLDELFFERCYARIYGSQLGVVAKLAVNPNGEEKWMLTNFLSHHKSLVHDSNVTDMDGFLSYLFEAKLIEESQVKSSVRGALIKLTDQGRAFYEYVQKHYPIGVIYKPF